MTSWRPDLSTLTGPAYLALVEALAKAIAEGRLRPGDRLPPQRQLAERLGLSLSTVTRACNEAARRGLLDGTVGRGSFVRRPAAGALPEATLARPADGPIDFANNLPGAGGGGAALAHTLADLAAAGGLGGLLDRGSEQEEAALLAPAARWLADFGLPAAERGLLATVGAQQGLLVALLALARPGDSLLVEASTYAGALALARHLDVRLRPVALDGEGLRPDALEQACRAGGARLLYTMPTLQTPTAVTQPLGRRQALAEVARRCDLTVIEDDVYGFLAPGLPPLAALLPERTLHLSSTSKCLAPGLRVGFLQAPAALLPRLRAAVTATSWMPPPLMVAIAARWLDDGTAAALAEEQRREATARQALARAILPPACLSGDERGYHLWLRLPEAWQPDAFEAAAAMAGVALRGAGAFAADSARVPRAVRLCLSHEPQRARVRAGLERIAELLATGPRADGFTV